MNIGQTKAAAAGLTPGVADKGFKGLGALIQGSRNFALTAVRGAT